MANGTALATPIVVAGASSPNLSGAAIPAPTPATLQLVAGGAAGTRGALANPASAGPAKVGRLAPGHGDQWFDRIHIIPRRVNLGFVLGGAQFTVEVWNAFMDRSKTLTQITVSGVGINVANPDTLPFSFPGSLSRTYTVTVAVQGDAQLANVLTWFFTGISVAGTNVEVSGIRLLAFPIPANMAEPIRMRHGYLTDVLEAYDGMEQRVQLRERPRRTLDFSILCETPREAQLAYALLYGSQALALGVPHWQWAVRLTLTAGAGASVVFCPTTSIPFEEGGLALLWRDSFTAEVVTIQTFNATSLQLLGTLAGTWPSSDSYVMPLGIGRLQKQQPYDWPDLLLGAARVAFDVDMALSS